MNTKIKQNNQNEIEHTIDSLKILQRQNETKYCKVLKLMLYIFVISTNSRKYDHLNYLKDNNMYCFLSFCNILKT